MYHYVREHDPRVPQFRYLHVDNFRLQLDHFEKTYGFVTKDEWTTAIQTGQGADGSDKIVLTFDDAMSCHYDYAFAELSQRGLWGIFYVPTQPYIGGGCLDVHRIHLLCGAHDGEALHACARDLVTVEMIPFEKRAEFQTKTYDRQTNLAGVNEFKRLMNYFCTPDARAVLLDQIIDDLGLAYDPAEFYVTPERLIEMQSAGMILGSHTVSHPVMSNLSRDAQSGEITQSFATLDKMGRTGPRTYCHPYGGFHSFDDTTVALLDAAEVSYSFNVESRDITDRDLQQARQCLPRYDCNEFPFGAAS